MQGIYTIKGEVIQGKKRGRELGYPTANVALSQSIPSGIYISLTNLDNKQYPSLTFIGEAKTFDETLFQSETYILDFSKDIYGEIITVALLKKIRENEKFISAQVLKEKMKEDEKLAREFFTSNSFNET